jgi:uncharacterized protein YcbK (DUF882 family)
MTEWRFFTIEEFACPCCGVDDMNLEFVDRLDDLRFDAEFPFKINSGYRCAAYNKKIGGAKHSAHVDGMGADIPITAAQFHKLMTLDMPGRGFTGIGVHLKGGVGFIHLDVKPREAAWTY